MEHFQYHCNLRKLDFSILQLEILYLSSISYKNWKKKTYKPYQCLTKCHKFIIDSLKSVAVYTIC